MQVRHNPFRSIFLTCLVQVPVILVGNKIDLRGGEVSNEDLENEVAPIMEEFKVYQFRPPADKII